MSFDKQRVVHIISNVIERSRSQADSSLRLSRGTLLNLMNRRRPSYAQMSRDEFQNMFTTRVDRKNIIPVEDVLCLVEAVLEYNPASMTAYEVLDLCDAARLPLREYKRLPRFFSAADWNSAWRLFDVARPGEIDEKSVFVARNSDFAAVLETLRNQRLCIVYGERGVGKTLFAQRVCARLEHEQQHHFALVNGRDLRSTEQLATQICQAIHVKLFGQETFMQRLTYYAKNTTFTVLIDDYVLSQHDDSFAVIQHVQRFFPRLCFVVTTSHPQVSHATTVPAYEVKPVENADAMQLYRHYCLQMGTYPVENPSVLAKLRQCGGNPLAIKMLAATVKSGGASVEKENRVSVLLQGITAAQKLMLDVLLPFEQPLSVPFITLLQHTDITKIDAVLADTHVLLARGVIQQYDPQMISLHAMVRVWMTATPTVQRRAALIDVILDSLLQQSRMTLEEKWWPILHRSDIRALLSFLQLVLRDASDRQRAVLVDVCLRWERIILHEVSRPFVDAFARDLAASGEQRCNEPAFRLFLIRLNFSVLTPHEIVRKLGELEIETVRAGDILRFCETRELMFWIQSRRLDPLANSQAAEHIAEMYALHGDSAAAVRFAAEFDFFDALYGYSSMPNVSVLSGGTHHRSGYVTDYLVHLARAVHAYDSGQYGSAREALTAAREAVALFRNTTGGIDCDCVELLYELRSRSPRLTLEQLIVTHTACKRSGTIEQLLLLTECILALCTWYYPTFDVHRLVGLSAITRLLTHLPRPRIVREYVRTGQLVDAENTKKLHAPQTTAVAVFLGSEIDIILDALGRDGLRQNEERDTTRRRLELIPE